MNCPRPNSIARRTGLALLVVIVLGAFLRLHGIGFLLPEQTEPDGVVYSAQVKDFQDDRIDEETRILYAFYPHLVARLAVGIAPRPEFATPAASLAEHVERASEPRKRIRIMVALLSLLAIPAVWMLARRFMAPAFAVGAAAFMASSFFTIWFAQQARPHAASTAFAALAVVAAVHLRAFGGWKAYLCAGLTAGLAVCSLQSGLAVLPAIATAVLFRWRAREESASRVALGSLLIVAIVALLVVIFYPFVFTSGQPGEIAQQNSMLNLSGHLVDLKLFNGGGFATIARNAWQYDPVICALAVLGILIGIGELWSRRKSLSRASRDELLVVLAFVVPYAIVIGLYERTYQRFVLPLTPFECVMAGYALCRIVSFAAGISCFTHRIAVAAAALVLAFQVFGAWRLVDARAEPSTIDESARWIESHVPRDARISLMTLMELPLQYTEPAFEASRPAQFDVSFLWFRYLARLGPAAFDGACWNIFAMQLTTPTFLEEARTDPNAFLKKQDADYAVVIADPRRPVFRGLRAAAMNFGTRVARFSPDAVDEGENLGFAYQDDDAEYTTPWFVRGLNARCVGPVVEIYKLR
ncbi:MAG: glycosyltransferase family 39 protein [Planctomycetota bacterium]|nr:glycosyltransferase family 39 protein [Planctomycetota bacterium]